MLSDAAGLPHRIRAKHALARVLLKSGLPQQRARHPDRAPSCRILCYHRIAAPPTRYFSLAHRLCVNPVSFRWQVSYLTQHFRLLSEKQLLECLETRFGPRDAYLTFDDGFDDAATNAAPVLADYDVPAVVFVCGDRRDRIAWWYDLAILIDEELEGKPLGEQLRWYRREFRRLARLPREQRERELVARCNKEWRQPRPPGPRLLAANDAVRLASQNIAVGAHGYSHEDLGRLDFAAVEQEIRSSIESVEALTGLRPRGFAYPFGKAMNLPLDADRVLRRSGLEYAVTTRWGLNRGHPDRYALERIVIDGTDDQAAFVCKVWGFLRT
ncbi:MAG: polysaccharide deacetylase family protein [Planctomycetota bacterium]